ncbi:tRNA pseudouridine synthase A 2 [Chlamydiales bacterium STE3]|nr:tRNA pseudouridine synthase A 2 [Chlamydiales bacterium STE3]
MTSLSNIRLTLVYDGTNYLGWQKTPLGPSIEEAIQKTLQRILQHEITLQAASRTDAGVHALGQVVNFFTSKTLEDVSKFKLSINALLPKDIRITMVEVAENDFHPTLDSNGKTYHYEICQGSVQLPQHRLYSWHVPKHLDIKQMKEASKQLIGKHDFSAFCNAKKNEVYQNKIRQVERIDFVQLENNRLKIAIFGRHFLYKMARNIVGTLVYVGLGKISVSQIPLILDGKDRTKAGMSAPAHGLTLFRVHYGFFPEKHIDCENNQKTSQRTD